MTVFFLNRYNHAIHYMQFLNLFHMLIAFYFALANTNISSIVIKGNCSKKINCKKSLKKNIFTKWTNTVIEKLKVY